MAAHDSGDGGRDFEARLAALGGAPALADWLAGTGRGWLRRLAGVSREAGAESATAAPSFEAVASAGERAVAGLREHGDLACLAAEERSAIESIVLLVDRPALSVQAGSFAAVPLGWEELEEARSRVEPLLPSIGRLELKGVPGVDLVGTAFVVAPDVVMTNRHVVRLFAEHRFADRWVFRVGRRPFIDYLEEAGSEERSESRIKKVLAVHEELDLALLRVKHRGDGPPPLPLVAAEPAEAAAVCTVGYPATDNEGTAPAGLLDSLLGGQVGVKRVSPGRVQRVLAQSPILAHDCSTLGGSSGSCVVDLASGQVLGLHFGGVFERTNHAVALWRLAEDPLLVRHGVAIGDPG